MLRNLALLVLSGLVTIPGAFALQNGAQRVSGYMRGQELWFTARGSASPIRSYGTDMGVYLHAIVVSDDLRSFEHLHPQLEPNGHFSFRKPLPRAGYYLYADAQPRGFGQQVFRFAVGIPKVRPRPDLSESATRSTAGPYAVNLTGSLHSGADSMLTVDITKNGMPANDLHPYLGAQGHAVLINATDLSYLHVHPMRPAAFGVPIGGGMAAEPMMAEGAHVPPVIALRVMVARPGIYKLWLQFRGGAHLYAAPFVLKAS